MKRKIIIATLSILILFSGIYLFRYSFVIAGTKRFLNHSLPVAVQYKDVIERNGTIFIRGIQYTEGNHLLHIQDVAVHLDLKKIFKNPFAFFRNNRFKSENYLQLVHEIKRYGIDIHIRNGLLQLGDERYFFQFKKEDKKNEIGTLSVANEMGLIDQPYLQIQLSKQDKHVLLHVKLKEVPSTRIYKLIAFAFPERVKDFENTKGNVELSAVLFLNRKGELDEIETVFSLSNLECNFPSKAVVLNLDNFKGKWSYSKGNFDKSIPFWKKVTSHFNIENCNVLYNQKIACTKLTGNFSLDPKKSPSISLKGIVSGFEKPLSLELSGRESKLENNAYGFDFGLKLVDELGTECESLLSLSKPEKELLLVEIKAINLLGAQVEMMKSYFTTYFPRLEEWKVEKGNFGGKLLALFEKNTLTHFEIRDLFGENITLAKGQEELFIKKLKGEGKIFKELQFDIDLPASQVCGFITPELKKGYHRYRPDDSAHVSATVRFGKSDVETSASVDFLNVNESIQFGFKSVKAFPSTLLEIKEGWARSSKLSHFIYGPLVKLTIPDIELYGSFDFTSHFDGKKIETSIQGNEIICKHPYLDLKAATLGEKEKTVGRAKFIYDFQNQSFQGTIPIRNAVVCDKRFGLFFTKVDADLLVKPAELTGHVSSADIFFDHTPLLKNGAFDFSSGDKTNISNLYADLPFQTIKPLSINVPFFDQESVEFSLLEDKTSLAHFKGKWGSQWEGILSVKPLGKELQILFDWNRRENNASLTAVSEGIALQMKKADQNYLIEKFQIGDLLGSCAFSPKNEGFQLTSFELEKKGIVIKGNGQFYIDLPKENYPFAVRSQLNIESEIHQPLPIKLKASGPISLVFSPSTGLILSGLDLMASGLHVQIDHLEHFFSQGKTTGRSCSFEVSDPFSAPFFEKNFLPSFLRDFHFFKKMKGKGNFGKEGKTISFSGAIQKGENPIDMKLDWTHPNGVLTLGGDEQLQFEFTKNENAFELQGIKGNFGSLSTDLKKTKDHKLKGEIKINLAEIDTFFDLPLKQYLNLWKTGGVVGMDGVFNPSGPLSKIGFKGKVRGENLRCNGYELKSLEAMVEIAPGKISIENIDVSDEAVKLWISEGTLIQSNMGWFFTFPQIDIRSFVPGSLRKSDGGAVGANGFAIKSATIKSLRGKIDDAKTIAGTGTLTFTNTAKSKLKPLPRNFQLRDLAQNLFDPKQFLPQSGEIDYQIQNGALSMNGLRISTGRGDLFELTGSPKGGIIGRLDFNGNLFIDLLLRQKVDRGSSPSVSFQVRGTVDEPQFTIR